VVSGAVAAPNPPDGSLSHLTGDAVVAWPGTLKLKIRSRHGNLVSEGSEGLGSCAASPRDLHASPTAQMRVYRSA
jgi:hypothetical protein